MARKDKHKRRRLPWRARELVALFASGKRKTPPRKKAPAADGQ